VFGGAFSLAAWLGGRALFEAMGGTGDTLENALVYSNVLFASAIPAWIASLLAAALRGAGNVRIPALVTAAGAFATLALSPLFIFGLGVVPGLGVAGAGLAFGTFNVGSAIVLALYMRSARSPLRLEGGRLREILGVGLPSAAGTVVANLTVVVTTGLVGTFGGAAIAGYGLASRLDYVLIPLLFALGTACVTMVGTNMGAGQYERARRIAWTSALISAAAVGAIGFAAAALAAPWMELFSREPDVVHAGVSYLVRVAPVYAFFGAGMALYFASQGAGKMAWPFAAGIVRLCIVALGGWYWTSRLQGSVEGLFWIVTTSYVVFGAINLFAMASGLGWGRKPPDLRVRTAQA
jgi:Na+-driven multidrug efflux pump